MPSGGLYQSVIVLGKLSIADSVNGLRMTIWTFSTYRWVGCLSGAAGFGNQPGYSEGPGVLQKDRKQDAGWGQGPLSGGSVGSKQHWLAAMPFFVIMWKNEPIFKALDLIRQMHQNCGNKPGYGRKNPKKRLIVAIAAAAAAASASAAVAVGAPAPGTIRAAAPPIWI